MGKSAPDRPKIGKMTKFMMSWNPFMSSIDDAMAMPNAVNPIPIRTMNPIAIRNPGIDWIERPIRIERIRIIRPCTTAVVAPPAVWPSMISSRLTGATSVSFRNPNCLSQMIWIPEKTDVNRTLIATIPGMRKTM